ncbi:MAG: hypothetical protein MJZ34_08320 [Paludibacteraceae bacterium]|nr:hypothetical protein [Paludibacteraceae bacterium]
MSSKVFFDRILNRLAGFGNVSNTKWLKRSSGVSIEKIIERVRFAQKTAEKYRGDVEKFSYWVYVERYWYNAYLAKYRKYELTHPISIHFDNEDVLITDPSYFLQYETWNTILDECNELSFPPKLNNGMLIKNIMNRDWDYDVFNCVTLEDSKFIGQISSNSGHICVTSLNNPIVDTQMLASRSEKPMTIIHNFTGDIYIKRIQVKGEEDSVVIEGVGNLNFITKKII